MKGIIRGMPTVGAIVVAFVSACSQDPQFIDKGVLASAGTDDLARKTCEVGGQATALECLVPRAQLAVEPGSSTLFVGQSRIFKAFIVSPDGEKKDVSKDVVWAGFPRTTVRVNGQGEATAIVAGDIRIEAVLGDLQATADVLAYAPDERKDPFVAVSFGKQLDHVTIPAGLSAEVEWSSKDVKSCQLLVDGSEIDRRSSGSATVKMTRDGQIEIICKTESDEEIRDIVEIVVTKPVVSLTANGAMGSVVVNKNSAVDLKWWSANATGCSVKADGVEVGSGLSGGRDVIISKGQTVQATCYDEAGNVATSSLNLALQYESRFVFSAGHSDKIDGVTAARPVSIIFALDVTGSMAAQIETVKTSVKDFVTELTNRDFKPMIGVIPFRDKVPVPGNLGDVPEGRLELTYDADVVKNFVSILRASGGGDANEASLGAIKESMSLLRNTDSRPDAIKIIMVISDQAGHSGQVTTDCDITTTVNHFGALSAAEQKNFKLFYSSPLSASPCSGFSGGGAQLNALLSKILTAEADVAKRGGAIPWPFAATNLVKDVVNLLVNVTPSIELACIDQSATISLSGAPFLLWKSSDPAYVFAQLEEAKTISVSKSLIESQHDAFIAGNGKLDITRCCVSRAAAIAGDYGSCLKTVTLTGVPFALED